jgi:hypothetical protein
MNTISGKSRLKSRLLCGLALAASLSLTAAAQDSHYWTHQYGMQGNLLGGIVIGSVTGLAGTYYNPGSLPFIDEKQVILASKVFEYSNTTLKSLAATGRDLGYSDLGQAPTMLAGAIKLRGLGRHWLGYSFLTRQSVNLDIAGTSTESLDLLPSMSGLEHVAVNYQLSERITETWWGLSWAYKISSSFGVGVSQYITVRAHHLDLDTGIQIGLPDGQVALSTGTRTCYYLNWRLLWKAGVIWDSPALTLGATLTTPSLGLYGRGYTGVNNTAVGPQPNTAASPDYVEADYQSSLKAGYRTPLSIGAGATIKFDFFKIYASAEWFSRVKSYAVMTGSDFVGQTSGLTVPNVVTAELKSVVNYGVGLEYIFRPDLKFYGSFLTDYTARPDNTSTNVSPADWNIYEFVGGAIFRLNRSHFALGLGVGFGKRNSVTSPGVFPPVPRLPLAGVSSSQDFSYSSAKIILGFSF